MGQSSRDTNLYLLIPASRTVTTTGAPTNRRGPVRLVDPLHSRWPSNFIRSRIPRSVRRSSAVWFSCFLRETLHRRHRHKRVVVVVDISGHKTIFVSRAVLRYTSVSGDSAPRLLFVIVDTPPLPYVCRRPQVCSAQHRSHADRCYMRWVYRETVRLSRETSLSVEFLDSCRAGPTL